MYAEDDLLPISALQHLLFCPRQCALIHVEGIWVENRLTAEGRVLHQRADQPGRQRRRGTDSVRGLPIRSLTHGLIGRADVVAFEGEDAIPIEYKRGRPKKNDCDRVQLCAQAICLEEMLGRPVPIGRLFYGKTRRQVDVAIDEPLRRTTLAAVERLREMVRQRHTPPAVREPKCDRCSLIEICLPDVTGNRRSARTFNERQFARHAVADGPVTDLPQDDLPETNR